MCLSQTGNSRGDYHFIIFNSFNFNTAVELKISIRNNIINFLGDECDFPRLVLNASGFVLCPAYIQSL